MRHRQQSRQLTSWASGPSAGPRLSAGLSWLLVPGRCGPWPPLAEASFAHQPASRLRYCACGTQMLLSQREPGTRRRPGSAGPQDFERQARLASRQVPPQQGTSWTHLQDGLSHPALLPPQAKTGPVQPAPLGEWWSAHLPPACLDLLSLPAQQDQRAGMLGQCPGLPPQQSPQAKEPAEA